MPVYNCEKFLAKSVESILAQSFTDFELLIIDDGSTDNSVAVVKRYADCDSRIRWVTQPNAGVSTTRNRLLAMATGEFIAVMDADDIAVPDRFALQVKFMRQHPNVVCVGGSHHLIDDDGRFLTTLYLPESDAEVQHLALAGHGSICHPCAMIRRWALLQVGGYDEVLKSAHDLDLWLKLGEVGQLANLKDVILSYRLHPLSLSGKNPYDQRKEAMIACERAWQRRGIEGKFEATEPWRPTADSGSRHQFMMQYGWWAFNSGERKTAAIYAYRAIATKPLALNGWKLLLLAIFKSAPQTGRNPV
jgi:glycosyltransferase involved in cell wall biosynthesis